MSATTKWSFVPSTANMAALSLLGDCVISHRPREFTLSLRPKGKHIHIGIFKSLSEAKKAAKLLEACV